MSIALKSSKRRVIVYHTLIDTSSILKALCIKRRASPGRSTGIICREMFVDKKRWMEKEGA